MTRSAPPNSPDAERAVLAACLMSKEALGTAIEMLKPDDFANIDYRTIFTALSSIYLEDSPADMVTLSERLKSLGAFDRIGGLPYLATFVNGVSTTANISTHSEIVREKS